MNGNEMNIITFNIFDVIKIKKNDSQNSVLSSSYNNQMET